VEQNRTTALRATAKSRRALCRALETQKMQNYICLTIRIRILSLLIIAIVNVPLFAGDSKISYIEPSKHFELLGWKLQVPGPKDISNLENYASEYFYLGKDNEMVFWLNSAEKGTTKNAKFVRSELRHLSNWTIDGFNKIEGILKVESRLNPDKVTVMKIHGFTKPGEYAPTLLRIALNDGNLLAFLNRSDTPKDIRSILLASKIDNLLFKCSIEVSKGHLTIKINDEVKFVHDISYWTYKNYFKAGCYPQSLKGEVKVKFKELSIWIDPS